ncbi:MAG: hypothetical protein IKN26_05010 [Eubacterium sp.]|nr:hypothetical protein [Eubacterium sp.]
MTFFSDAPLSARSIIAASLFLALICLLVQIIYSFSRNKTKTLIFDSLLFFANLIFVSLLSAAANSRGGDYEINLPLLPIILYIAFVFIYSTARIIRTLIVSRNTLSPLSIKQALDNLNSGLCFADSSGKIVLINHTFGNLISSLIGEYPQTLDETEKALEGALQIDEAVEKTYKFNDGSVWKFTFLEINEENLRGFSQIYAQNISDLYEVNQKLIDENEELRKTNEKTKLMLERLADRIREQETLKLKMLIHDDIGTSLIKIAKIIQGDKNESIKQQLSLLENAVSFFANNKVFEFKNADEVYSKAKALGVELIMNGELPKDESACELILSAINECLTNCVIHAGGNRVFADISESENAWSVSITNNGKAPEGEITEGGGLTSLRRKTENLNGEMKVLSDKEFMLILNLRKDNYND